MLDKKYLPSLGFFILLATILSSGLFFKWALGPLSYEKATVEGQLEHQLVKSGIRYTHRSSDGWSEGKSASAILNVLNDKTNYVMIYFTSNPKKLIHKVKVILDDKVVFKKEVKQSQKEKYEFFLKKGKHKLDISINETFNPMKLGIGEDNRELGVNFVVKRKGAK